MLNIFNNIVTFASEPGQIVVISNISTRVKATFIDLIVVILSLFTFQVIIESLFISSATAYWIAAILAFLYEPFFTSKGSTLGQKTMGIRVKQLKFNAEEIITQMSFAKAILRFIIKILLGWFSLLTVASDSHGRALHDHAVGSVMLDIC